MNISGTTCTSIDDCTLDCSRGMQTDNNGCEICECIPCPSVICATPCENGLKLGNDGCPSCECNDGKIV